jgi:hypothetical protein
VATKTVYFYTWTRLRLGGKNYIDTSIKMYVGQCNFKLVNISQFSAKNGRFLKKQCYGHFF